ncbi:hypothetical protein Tco_0189275 [Tanacetum coccineum]
MVRNANPLALVAAAQHYPDDYTQSPKPYKTHAQSSRQTPSTRSHATARNKGKEIVKPPPPPSDQHMKKTVMKNRLKEICIYRKVWHLLQNTSRTSIDLPTTTLELHQILGTRILGTSSLSSIAAMEALEFHLRMWILGTNLIFAFPCKFWSSFRVPSYFDYRNTNLFQLLDFLIYNLYWFLHKLNLSLSWIFHGTERDSSDKFFFRLKCERYCDITEHLQEAQGLYALGPKSLRILTWSICTSGIKLLPRFPDSG